MREQLDLAQRSGVVRVQLEVLTQNWAARSYERAGFVTTRRLAVLQGILAVPDGSAVVASAASWVEPEDVPNLAEQLARLHGAVPAPWTREPSATLEAMGGLRCLVVGPLEDPMAVALVRPHDGGVQVVDAVAEGASAAQALVAELASAHPGSECRLVNEPGASPLVPAFATAGLVEVLAQHEMHWTG
jgi:hypothetical protein